MSVTEVLEKALAVLDGGKRWTQVVSARNEQGARVPSQSPDAAQFCVVGVLQRVCPPTPLTTLYYVAHYYLSCAAREISGNPSPIAFNDARGRKYGDVEQLFKRAIELAQAEGH